MRFGKDKSDQEIAVELGISEEAYRKRMGEIYRKFNIVGKGPGKHNRLTNILHDEFKQLSLANPNSEKIDIDDLVKQARHYSHANIQERCGTMRVLDMTQPIGLDEIYINIEVLEKITSRRRLEINELEGSYNQSDSNRIRLAEVYEGRISGLEALRRYQKLILMGKPGAGKTTLLKYTALQCSRGALWSELVPIFITLRQFASIEGQPKLLDYIIQEFSSYGMSEAQGVRQVLKQGRALILLDGLDEIREEDNNRLLEEIRSFSEQFYLNHFVISSRLASQQYIFEKFTEVEVADFEPLQIHIFADKWFMGTPCKSKKLIEKLEGNQPLKELATSPLLLTLLCLVFEESGDFPSNRSELYKEGLDVLLRKWDAKRNIERYQIYKKLSNQRKEDLLSQIALTTFEKGDYFFKQEELELYIADYIRNLPNASTDSESLQLDSEAILKSIESQHGIFIERAKGIYSFSHLTFQEYLAARGLANSPERLTTLASKASDKRWVEVIRLATSMLRCADHLLLSIKEYVDRLIAEDLEIQHFLQWVSLKSASTNIPFPKQFVRIFYFSLGHIITCAPNSYLPFVLARTLALDLDLSRISGLKLDESVDLSRAFDLNLDLGIDLDLDLNLALQYARETKATTLVDQLESLIAECPDDAASEVAWQNWTDNLRQTMIECRNIGHAWQFNDTQKEVLHQYYDANHLLIECLFGDCYVTQSVRQEIAETTLLPRTG